MFVVVAVAFELKLVSELVGWWFAVAFELRFLLVVVIVVVVADVADIAFGLKFVLEGVGQRSVA